MGSNAGMMHWEGLMLLRRWVTTMQCDQLWLLTWSLLNAVKREMRVCLLPHWPLSAMLTWAHRQLNVEVLHQLAILAAKYTFVLMYISTGGSILFLFCSMTQEHRLIVWWGSPTISPQLYVKFALAVWQDQACRWVCCVGGHCICSDCHPLYTHLMSSCCPCHCLWSQGSQI